MLEASLSAEIPHIPSRVLLGAAVVASTLSGCSKSARSYVERGDAELKAGNVAAAELEYRNAVSRDPVAAPARQRLAEAYLAAG